MRSLTLSSILKDLLNSMKLALDSIKNHTVAIASQEEVVTKLQNYQNGIDKKLEDAKTQAATALNQHNSSTSAHQDIRNQMATLNQKYTDDMVALRQDLSTVYHYKSSVNSYNDLPKSGMKVGDTYNIQTKDDMHGIRPGDNVSWNGTDWDNLSGIVDLSRLLPKSGGVITGDLSVQGKLHANADTATKVTATAPVNGSADLVYGTMAGTDAARIHISDANDRGELELATSDNGDETIVVRQYYHGGAGTFTDVAREAYILNSEGNTSFPGTVTAPRFSGVLNGNAATASKLATPRTITLAGGVTGSTTFDGSSNVIINATITQSANAATADAATTIKNFEQGTANAFRNVWFSDNTNNAKPVYNESIQYNPSTNVLKAGTFQGALNGNADTATDADKLDGYHENAFLRAREDASSNQENTLWDQIGIKQYANKLPDSLADAYNYGATVSFPAVNARFDLWYSNASEASKDGIRYRTGWDDRKNEWREILDSMTYNKYAPKLDGTGAKGTWNINISGTSERSNHINTQEVGHTDNTERRVFVSGSGDNTIQCYDPSMTYNSATQTLTVKAINGTAAKAAQDAAGNVIADTYETKANVNEFMDSCTEDEIKKLWVVMLPTPDPEPEPPASTKIVKTFDANVFLSEDRIIISNETTDQYIDDAAFKVAFLDNRDSVTKENLYKISEKDNFYGIGDNTYKVSIKIGNPPSTYDTEMAFSNTLNSASLFISKNYPWLDYKERNILSLLFNGNPAFKSINNSKVLSEEEYADDVFTALGVFLDYTPYYIGSSESNKISYSTFVDNLKKNSDSDSDSDMRTAFQYLSSLHNEYYTIIDTLTNSNTIQAFDFMSLFNKNKPILGQDGLDCAFRDIVETKYHTVGGMDPKFFPIIENTSNIDYTKINSPMGVWLIYLMDFYMHYNHIDFEATPLAINTIPVTVTLKPVDSDTTA